MRQRERISVEVYGRLVRAVHAIAQGGAQELRQEGLTPAQYQVLVLVGERPDVAQQELVTALGVTKGNISMLVTRLESEGLVVRTPAGAAYALRLTEDGDRLVHRLRPQHARYLSDRFAALDDTELHELHRLIGVLET